VDPAHEPAGQHQPTPLTARRQPQQRQQQRQDEGKANDREAQGVNLAHHPGRGNEVACPGQADQAEQKEMRNRHGDRLAEKSVIVPDCSFLSHEKAATLVEC